MKVRFLAFGLRMEVGGQKREGGLFFWWVAYV